MTAVRPLTRAGWTRDLVEAALEEAARTMRFVPDPPGSRPRGYGSSWPDYVRDPWHAYGYHAARAQIVPSAAEIDRMDEVLEWLAWLDPVDAKIVWFRAAGMRWAQLGRKVKLSRSSCWRRWAAGLITLERSLRNGRKPGRGRPAASLKP